MTRTIKSVFPTALVLTSLWLILLLNLTPIILVLSGESINSRAFNEKQPSPRVHAHMDSLSEADGLLQEVNFEGWAFVETVEENPNKRVSLLLRAGEREYPVKADVFDRNELVDEFPELNVPLKKQGFIGSFSALNLTDGRYEIWVDVSENEAASGLVKLDNSILRDGQITSTAIEGKEVDLGNEEIKTESRVRGSLDLCAVNGPNLAVKGWVFQEGSETADDIVVLRFTSANGTEKVFTTRKFEQPGVVAAFASELYRQSGFYFELPQSEFQKVSYSVEIILLNKKISSANLFTCDLREK